MPLIPDGRTRQGKAAAADLLAADIPAPGVIHAADQFDEEIADMLLAAAERMGPVRVVRADGTTVVFTPAPTTTEGPRFL
ncbi:hypothetical protein KGD82_16670 [Nocardiopsis eucommiae]|uniref:Uncharacterized protein n=1 Tax=Nocardiopsis eucommiae TaxID=2831970 RepID=A0A975QJE5_9ACTN|nr:hypothetical protein KGD82_16670 [Nocardiopsis eucommiae]